MLSIVQALLSIVEKNCFGNPCLKVQKIIQSNTEQAVPTVRIKVKQSRATIISNRWPYQVTKCEKQFFSNISFMYYMNSKTCSMVGNSMFPHVSSVNTEIALKSAKTIHGVLSFSVRDLLHVPTVWFLWCWRKTHVDICSHFRAVERARVLCVFNLWFNFTPYWISMSE